MKKAAATIAAGVLALSMSASVFAAEAPQALNTADMKVSSYSTNNTNVSRDDTGNIYVGYAVTDNALVPEESNFEGSVDTITLDATVEGEGFTAVRSDASKVTVTGSLNLTDKGDGHKANDFAAVGAGISAFNGSEMTIDGLNYYSEGFGRSLAIIENSTAFIKNTQATTMGADAFQDTFDGYYNSAQTTTMVSPPWVLGINGGIRAVNILGVGTTAEVADSTINSSGWAVVSTDGCTSPYIYIFNSNLNILSSANGGVNSGYAILGYDPAAYGSGYCTFYIGGANETFRGASLNGGTYAAIMNGGTGYYASLKAGETYEVKTEAGDVVDTYTAAEDKATEINTVFSILGANSGDVTFAEGTVVNTADATIIYKSGDSTFTFDNAVVNPGNGIIVQMMDNDDTTIGGFDPFGTYLYEEAGFQTAAYEDAISYVFTEDTAVNPEKTYYVADLEAEGGFVAVENPIDKDIVVYYEKATGGNRVDVNFANGEYTGDIYNGTGYYAQASDALYVNIDDTATLTGDIALTSHVHGVWPGERTIDDVEAAIAEANEAHKNVGGYYADTEDIKYVYLNNEGTVTDDKSQASAIQFTQFSTQEYYLVGHVLNQINYNGLSTIDVTVEGKWKVADCSLVTYLNVVEGAEVYGELVELEDGSILITPSESMIPAGEYGEAHIHVVDPDASSSGGESSGESAESAEDAESSADAAEGAESAEVPADGAEAADSEAGESDGAESAEVPAEGEAPAGESGGGPAEAPAE
ncbi:MAG: hypothetical protein HUJ76_02065 [Parasporobacterium sp.]|nr:hypothetical protein [Parasporobacterium sp.]